MLTRALRKEVLFPQEIKARNQNTDWKSLKGRRKQEHKWGKSHRVFLKIQIEPEVCASVHQPSMSCFNAEHPHHYTKSLTRSSFSHFNSSDSQRPQVTLQEKEKKQCTLQLAVSKLGCFACLFSSWVWGFFYSLPRSLLDHAVSLGVTNILLPSHSLLSS